MNKYAVFYAKSRRFLETLKRFGEGNEVEGMSLNEFHDNFAYVGTFEGKKLDDVFSLLQDGGGGLGVTSEKDLIAGRMMQELVVRPIGHTSMSKGDAIVDLQSGEVYLCASFGWDKLVITGMRELTS